MRVNVTEAVPVLSAEGLRGSRKVYDFVVMVGLASLFVQVERVKVDPRPGAGGDAFVVIPVVSCPVSLPSLGGSGGIASSFFSAVSLGSTTVTATASVVTPDPRVEVST